MMDTNVSRVFAAVSSFRVSAVLCLLLAAKPLHAEPMTEPEVAGAVETWLRGVIADARADATVESMEPHVVDGKTVAHIVRLASGGFCLSGADDLVLPVYFYSPEGAYDPDNPSHEYILWEIGVRLRHLQDALKDGDPTLQFHQAALGRRAAFWGDLAARRIPERGGGPRGRAEPDLLVLPLTSSWGQGSPYNDECPALPGDGATLVGCVATAMSQIMYYWRWPDTGVGTHNQDYTYRWRFDWDSEPLATNPAIDPNVWAGRLYWGSGFEELRMSGYWDSSIYSSARKIDDDAEFLAALAALYNRLTPETVSNYANFGATTYDWSTLDDTHADPVDGGDAEVAQLCHHAGISVDMRWGSWSSTSDTGDVANALETYFRYDPDTTFAVRDTDVMTEEIQWLRPVQIRGAAWGGGGHSWIAYGYDKSTDPDRLFKMNFGWYGSSDGWYSVDDINLDFYINQQHVTQIAPAGVVKFVGGGAAGDGSPSAPYEDIAAAIDSAPGGATIIFKAGSDNVFAGGPLVIDRPATLKGYDIRILRE